MRRSALTLWFLLLAGVLDATARPGPVLQHSLACNLTDAADTVAKHGLAFIGPPWVTEYLLVSRKPNSLIGISTPVRLALRRSLANRLYPDVTRLPNVTFGSSYRANVETLLRHGPAVIVQSVFADRLLSLGLCTVPFGTAFGTSAAIADHTRMFAAIAGSPAHAGVLIQRFDAAMAGVAGDLAAVPLTRPPRVLVISIMRYGMIIAEGGLHPATEFIARAGGVNALLDQKSRGVHLDAEHLLALDPDDLFIVENLGDHIPDLSALRASRVGHLRAIATGHVYALPPDWTLINSVVATPAYERWMAERLHPGLPGDSARDALRRAYEEDVGIVLPGSWLDYALAEPRQ